jgi:RNA polymerase sigma factor (sigma-70 family)
MMITTEYIWEFFHDPLQQFIRKHVPDASTAEDILQDVFLNIHTHLATLKDQDKLYHWLYQIARHAIIDHARRHKVTETLSDTFNRTGTPPALDMTDVYAFAQLADEPIDAVIEGGISPWNRPTTIVDTCATSQVIVRAGIVDERTIRKVIPDVLVKTTG